MIRVELIDQQGHFVRSMDFQNDLVRVGRGLDCDVIVPDFHFALEQIKIVRTEKGYLLQTAKEELSIIGQLVYKLKGYKIRVTDLSYYARQSEPEVTRPEWVLSASLFAIILATFLFGSLVASPFPKENAKILEEISGTIVLILVINLLLALVSRAINGEYRLWSIATAFFISAIGILALANNFLGLRWLLPNFFWNEQVWQFLFIVWVAYGLWLMSKVILDHLSQKIRISLVGFLFLLICIISYSGYFSSRETYQYAKVLPKPPLIEVFESRPVDQETFLSQVDNLFQ